MSYIKFEHRSLGHARWLTTSPEAFTVHVYALDYCNEQATDGFIPDAVARRLVCPTDPSDIPAAFAELVANGAWLRVEGGYRCPGFLAHGLAADEQDRTRAKWAEDKRRQRNCRIGNHDLCTPKSKCRATVAVKDSSDGHQEASPGVHPQTSGRSDPTRPDQTPTGVWEGERGGGGALDADAPRAAPGAGEQVVASPWRPVGDCPHRVGGLDVHQVHEQVRCRQCRRLAADDAPERRRSVEHARARLDAVEGGPR